MKNPIISSQKEISIVMPAFNEEAKISKTVRDCFAALRKSGVAGEVVVTNDGSSDDTGKALEVLTQEFPELKVITHQVNAGYGEALKDAVLGASGKYIISIDSDGQFDISEMFLLIEEQKKGDDVITGFRKKKQDSFFKRFADRGLNLIIRMLFGISYRDTNCALKLYSPGVLDKINIEARGYQAPTEILLKLHALKFKIGQVGITHFPRKKGKSALSPMRTIYQMLLFLLYLRLKLSLYRKKIIKRL